MDLEGVFRLSGRQMLLEEMREGLNQGGKIEIDSTTEPHSVAGLLKLWLRELPDPLVTIEMCQTWQTLKDITPEAENMIPLLKKHINSLTPNRKFVLQHLMKLLSEVAEKQDVNKMSPSNLGIVFGPNLIKKRAHGAVVESYEEHTNSRADLVAFLIEHYSDFFASVEEERAERVRTKKSVWAPPSQSFGTHSTSAANKRQFLVRRGGGADERGDPSIATPTTPTIEKTGGGSRIGGSHIGGTATTAGSSGNEFAALTKEGWLKKKGGRRSNWKNRWFVLKYKSLSYFKSPTDPKPKGRVVLKNCVIGTSTRKPYCFCISTKEPENRTYLFVARDEQDKQDWMSAIVQCIEQNSENLGLTNLIFDMDEKEDLFVNSPPSPSS